MIIVIILSIFVALMFLTFIGLVIYEVVEYKRCPGCYIFEDRVILSAISSFTSLFLLILIAAIVSGSVIDDADYFLEKKHDVLIQVKADKETFGDNAYIYYQGKVNNYNESIEKLKSRNNYWCHTKVVSEEEINYYLITQSEIDAL